MDEPVGVRQALDEFLTESRPQSRADMLLQSPKDDRKCRDLGAVSETSQLLQRILRFDRQAGELPDHKVHHVVGVALGVNAVEIPGPARSIMIEDEHLLFGERRYELDGEKRIAAGLPVHQLRQRRGALRFAAKSVRNQLPEMLLGERRKRDLRHLSAGALDGVQFPRQRMAGSDFVVAIGADQHEALQIRSDQQIFEQIKCRRVKPLQVVKEERQWMLRPGEDADKPPKHQLETPLRVLGRKLRRRRLVADDELQFGDEIDH